MTIFVELLDRSINVDVILSTIDLPPVIVPLVSLEIPTLERLRSPASRGFENRLEHSIRYPYVHSCSSPLTPLRFACKVKMS